MISSTIPYWGNAYVHVWLWRIGIHCPSMWCSETHLGLHQCRVEGVADKGNGGMVPWVCGEAGESTSFQSLQRICQGLNCLFENISVCTINIIWIELCFKKMLFYPGLGPQHGRWHSQAAHYRPQVSFPMISTFGKTTILVYCDEILGCDSKISNYFSIPSCQRKVYHATRWHAVLAWLGNHMGEYGHWRHWSGQGTYHRQCPWDQHWPQICTFLLFNGYV